MIRQCISFLCAILLCAISVQAAPAGTQGCPYGAIGNSITMKLIDRKFTKYHTKTPTEFGQFEIENQGTKTILLHGEKWNGEFYILQPYVYLQALSIDRSWVVLGAIPAEYDIPPDKVEIPPNSTTRFMTQIHFQRVPKSTDLLRLMLFNGELKSCFLSDSFQEYEPQGGVAQGKRRK